MRRQDARRRLEHANHHQERGGRKRQNYDRDADEEPVPAHPPLLFLQRNLRRLVQAEAMVRRIVQTWAGYASLDGGPSQIMVPPAKLLLEAYLPQPA